MSMRWQIDTDLVVGLAEMILYEHGWLDSDMVSSLLDTYHVDSYRRTEPVRLGLLS